MRITLVKSKGDSHTLEPGTTKPHIKLMLHLKYVRTAHMPYAKVVNFLDMERFHDNLGEYWSFSVRDTSFQLSL